MIGAPMLNPKNRMHPRARARGFDRGRERETEGGKKALNLKNGLHRRRRRPRRRDARTDGVELAVAASASLEAYDA